MAITSVDSYLLEEIEPRLKTVLKNCYIIDEVLKDYNQSTIDNFKEGFCGENANHEVTVGFKTPEFKNNTKAHYLIQLGQAEESNTSFSNIQADYLEASGNTFSEFSTAYKEEDRLKLKVSKPIHEVINVEHISFAKFDDLKWEDNVISFRYEGNESLENYQAVVNYVEKTGDTKGLVKGFTVNEEVTVVGLSDNVDTARCLDAILKMILISMRDNLYEQQSLQLQRLKFGDLSPIITDTNFYIWGRPTIITYQTSIDMDYNITQEINKLTFKE
ncbi:MAG: hypothetical protein L0L95_11490, partial [Staphylococcus equorum]|nr:hypothetical protein [Staphylococcus equorum]